MAEMELHWRDRIRVDAAADLLPPMPADELIALGEDIQEQGLRQPIVLYFDMPRPEEWAYRQLPLDSLRVLDGRSRLDAMERVGIELFNGDGLLWPKIKTVGGCDPIIVLFPDDIDHDPLAYALSANLHRRHLTAEDKREVILKLLKTSPERSDREIARLARVDHKTVGLLRGRAQAVGEIPQLDERVGADGKKRKSPTARANEKSGALSPSSPRDEAISRFARLLQRQLPQTLAALTNAVGPAIPNR